MKIVLGPIFQFLIGKLHEHVKYFVIAVNLVNILDIRGLFNLGRQGLIPMIL
jgi:hypothetical protein